MRLTETFYRAHDPRWSFSPLSGDGAKTWGGRFNPKGTAALYLASTPMGALKDGAQGFLHKIDPLMLVTYEIDCDDILDLTDSAILIANSITPADLNCPWRDELRVGKVPASWTLAERLIADGVAGIIVPSVVIGATPEERNLVLWNWGPDLPHQVNAYDPNNRLPKNQLSWD